MIMEVLESHRRLESLKIYLMSIQTVCPSNGAIECRSGPDSAKIKRLHIEATDLTSLFDNISLTYFLERLGQTDIIRSVEEFEFRPSAEWESTILFSGDDRDIQLRFDSLRRSKMLCIDCTSYFGRTIPIAREAKHSITHLTIEVDSQAGISERDVLEKAPVRPPTQVHFRMNK